VNQLNPVRSGFDRWLDNHSDLAALAIVAVGFGLRLWTAHGTFLNPDEALHFLIANRASLADAYRASLTMAHPPLLIFVIYFWRNFGTSEFVLRLPSVLAGTAFCWVFYKWASQIFGRGVAFVPLIFVACLAPMVDLSAELRQYELLLLFLISGAYFFERAITANSALRMAFSAICLYLGILSHYSSLLFVATLGIYAAIRIFRRPPSATVVAAWIIGQLGAVALIAFLYKTHLSKIKGTTMSSQAFEGWLFRSYYHSGHGGPVVFLVARTFSVFQFLLGQFVVGDVAVLLFFAGIVFLWRGKVSQPASRPTAREAAILLLLPFAVNCAAGLTDAYPYGGTRHCVFLVIFVATGLGCFLTKISNARTARAAKFATVIILLCWGFRSYRHPYMTRANQSVHQMSAARAFVEQSIPASDLIFTDYESSLEFGHYLCDQKPVSYDGTVPGFLVFQCAGHRIVSTVPDLWTFELQTFPPAWSQFVRSAALKPGETVWIAQAGWDVKLADTLARNVPEFRDLRQQAFGKNIGFFPRPVE
jgi:hypothetical protein